MRIISLQKKRERICRYNITDTSAFTTSQSYMRYCERESQIINAIQPYTSIRKKKTRKNNKRNDICIISFIIVTRQTGELKKKKIVMKFQAPYGQGNHISYSIVRADEDSRRYLQLRCWKGPLKMSQARQEIIGDHLNNEMGSNFINSPINWFKQSPLSTTFTF